MREETTDTPAGTGERSGMVREMARYMHVSEVSSYVAPVHGIMVHVEEISKQLHLAGVEKVNWKWGLQNGMWYVRGSGFVPDEPKTGGC